MSPYKSGSPLFLAEDIKAFEQTAATHNDNGLSTLMERAGASLFRALQSNYPNRFPYHIVCGNGNNGGDGLVLARLAKNAGVEVAVYMQKPSTSHDAVQALNALLETGAGILPLDEFDPADGVIVDCIFGIGLRNGVGNPWDTCIERINQCELPVVSVDVPSGLDADRGTALGAVVKADLTLTFIAEKPGLLTGIGPDVCGDVLIDTLGVNVNPQMSGIFKMKHAMFEDCLPERHKDAHKGHFGHVLVIGGDKGFGGAALLASTAALRSGAGLVSVITHPAHAASFLSSLPELMVNGLNNVEDHAEVVEELLQKADVIVLGPGLGQEEFGSSFYTKAIDHIVQRGKPAVLDADALNLLAKQPIELPSAILTPHPGEAARLLSETKEHVRDNRLEVVQQLHEQFGAMTLLKGAGSLVCDGETVLVCGAGNPGMATGGTGDVLSGVIGGLLAQGIAADYALPYGVWLHACAGDYVTNLHGEVGFIASDLIPEIRNTINDTVYF